MALIVTKLWRTNVENISIVHPRTSIFRFFSFSQCTLGAHKSFMFDVNFAICYPVIVSLSCVRLFIAGLNNPKGMLEKYVFFELRFHITSQ